MMYYAPKPEFKTYNGYGELETQYEKPIATMCIFDEHPTQKSMKKLGWDSEIADGTVVIHVKYDLPRIQAGALFEIPSGLDEAEPRRFRVARLSNIAQYPASVSCELVPVFVNNGCTTTVTDFKTSDFNLLYNPEEDQ